MRRIVNPLLLAGAALAVTVVGAPKAEAAELNLQNAGCATVGGTCAAGTGITVGSARFFNFAGALWSISPKANQPTASSTSINPFLWNYDSTDDTNPYSIDGHNTSATSGLLNDEVAHSSYTKDVLSEKLKVLSINGNQYFQFLLDVNWYKGNNDQLVTLNDLEICLGATGGLKSDGTCPGSKKYDLDSGGNNKVTFLADDSTSPFNAPDLYVYIPTTTLFSSFPGGITTTNDYLYLWSNIDHNLKGAHDKWAYLQNDVPVTISTVPEPTTLVMLGTGLLFAVGTARRRNRRQAASN